jgi:hypothetical protein
MWPPNLPLTTETLARKNTQRKAKDSPMQMAGTCVPLVIYLSSTIVIEICQSVEILMEGRGYNVGSLSTLDRLFLLVSFTLVR